MSGKILILGAIVFVSALTTSAERILPDSFARWNASARNVFSPSQTTTTETRIPAEAAEEYGFAAGERDTYERGPARLEVTLYRMKDPSGAYGEYSFLRTQDMPHADLTEHSAMSRDHALVLDGNLVLDVRGSDLPKLESDLKALVAEVGHHAEDGPLPTIWQHLPTDRMVERSDHYILGPAVLNLFFPVEPGDWLGFAHGAEAEEARYRLNGHEVTLLIADYPTPQIAADELRRLGQRLNVNGSNPSARPPALFAKRTVTKLSFVSGASTGAEAGTLLEQIQSGTEVTWNEPTFQFQEPSIEMMIVGAIFGTGTICLFAVIAGLAFGGFRIFIKRALPDKVFDRSSHLQVLQLGLASKPINAEDFYGMGGPPAPEAEVDEHLPDRIAMRIFR
jgi:uncharacterized protein DUF6599